MHDQAPQAHSKSSTEVRNIAVSFAGKLDSGELLTGVPTVTVSPSGPTLANKLVTTTAKTINGASVAAGAAVTFNVTGGTAGVKYTITITVGTDATPAQTLQGIVILRVHN